MSISSRVLALHRRGPGFKLLVLSPPPSPSQKRVKIFLRYQDIILHIKELNSISSNSQVEDSSERRNGREVTMR